jgi:hypothetical protein
MSKGHRRVATALLSGLLVVGLGACGDDDKPEARSDNDSDEGTGLTAAAPTASAEFCEGFRNLDVAFANAPEDPSELPAFVAEQVDPNLALVEENIPTQVSGGVSTMVTTVEQVKESGDTSLFESPEFMSAQGEVYPFLAEGCGWQPLETTAVDYAFEGMPETIEAGMTVLTIENTSEAGELHEIALMKLAEGTELSAEEIFALPEEEAQQHLDPEAPPVFAFAAPGGTGGVTADLTPGEYVYACFIPTGTTMDAEGTGAPHFMEGMMGSLTVT